MRRLAFLALPAGERFRPSLLPHGTEVGGGWRRFVLLHPNLPEVEHNDPIPECCVIERGSGERLFLLHQEGEWN